MAKVTREQIECDLCGVVGVRYTVSYPEGMKVLDRCGKHDKRVIDLKDEPGEWTAIVGKDGHKRGISVHTPEEIEALKK